MYVQNAHISNSGDAITFRHWEMQYCCWCSLRGGVVLFDCREAGEVTAFYYYVN
jgi:hypothetical protein